MRKYMAERDETRNEARNEAKRFPGWIQKPTSDNIEKNSTTKTAQKQ